MANRRYEKGRRFEQRIRKRLKSIGFFVVRAAGSKPIDLVAIKDGKTVLIECKKYKRLIRPDTRLFLETLGKQLQVETTLAYNYKNRIIFEVIYSPYEKPLLKIHKDKKDGI